MKQARFLFVRDRDSQVNTQSLSVYIAGVAAECMLRAFITRRDRQFEGRHDLILLYAKSRMWEIKPGRVRTGTLAEEKLAHYKQELDAAINTLNRLWRNAYRYADESRLRSHLHEIDPGWRGRGNLLGEKLRVVLAASSKIIDRGTILWESDPTSPRA